MSSPRSLPPLPAWMPHLALAWMPHLALRGALLCLALSAAACSELQPIEANRCGNRVVEKGEACDEGSETTLCTAECRLPCVGKSDAPASYVDNPEDAQAEKYCPAGQACGVGGLCAAPSGKFRTETTFEFDVPQAEVGDVDGDDAADLVGTGATEIRIRFGDADGAPLASASHMPAPAATGPFLLGDLDGKGGIDLAIPSDGGVVPFYASDSGTLQHRPSPTLSIPRDGFVAAVDGTVPAGGGSRRPLLVYIETQGNFAVLRDLVTTGNPELARCDTGAPVGLVRRVPLAISTTNSGDLIAIGIERPVDPGVCVFAPGSPVLPADPGWIPRFHRLATGARFDLELVPLVWANTDGDACPELVAPVLTGPGAGTPGQNLFDNTAATCTFATASALVPTWALNGAKVLGAGNLDRVGADELVTSKNVVRIDSLAAAVPLGQAVGMDRLKVADFNGDGIVDIAGTDPTTAGAGEASREAVRILRTSGPPGTWQASTVVVETLRPVLQLVVGDFDGDRIADLALTEVMALDQNRVPLTMAVSVIYGQRSEIPSYQVVLETDAVVIAALGLRRGGQHDEDGVDDLGVAKITAGGSTKLAASVLYGSAQRSLTAPLTVGAGVPVAALTAGAWAGADLLKDLVVYAGNFQYVWPQQTGGNFVITGTGTSTPVEPAGLRDFAITPAMTAGGTSTIVSFSAATQKVAVGGIGACPGSWTGSGTQGVGTRPTLQARNLDGNPGDELLLTSLEGTGIQPVQIFPAIGGECKMGAGLLPLVHPLATCDAAVGIEAGTVASDDPKRREVLAVCRRAGGSVLSRFDVAPGGETVGTALDVKLTGRAKRLMVGDFTGDGLEDAVAITSVGSVDFATLLVQCSTTDASCDQ